jgi:hypothetical protein
MCRLHFAFKPYLKHILTCDTSRYILLHMQDTIYANSYIIYLTFHLPQSLHRIVHGFKNPRVFALYILQNWVYTAILDKNKGNGLIYSNLIWELITVLVNNTTWCMVKAIIWFHQEDIQMWRREKRPHSRELGNGFTVTEVSTPW